MLVAWSVSPDHISIIRIASRFGHFTAKQKLLPHFSEASAAIFAIKEIEYCRHD